MAAIIGPAPSEVENVLRDNALTGIDVANYNSPSQTVISGPIVEIRRAEQVFRRPDVQLFAQLPVSAAFHSRYMAAAQETFGRFLSAFSFADLRIPVISNVTARPYPKDGGAEAVRSLLTRQIASPVRWEETVRFLKGNGVIKFTEVGPGNVLTRLIQQIAA